MRRDSEPAALSDDERRIWAGIEADLDLGAPGFAARYVLASAGAALMGAGAAAGAQRAEVAARRASAFLGWWVDPDDRAGLRRSADRPE